MVHFDFFLFCCGLGLMTALSSVLVCCEQYRHFMNLENSLDGLVENAFEISLSKSRALQIFDCFDVFRYLDGLFILYWCHLPLSKLLSDFGVVSKVEFRSHEDDGNAWRMMFDFRIPLRQLLSVTGISV